MCGLLGCDLLVSRVQPDTQVCAGVALSFLAEFSRLFSAKEELQLLSWMG